MDYKENSKPIYMQIADRICDSVMSGTYQIGERIPSVRESAAAYKVNANTMMRTYEYLASRGIIQNQRGIGFFTTPGAHDEIKRVREETFFNDELRYFFDRLSNMGITPVQLHKLYTDYINKKV